MKRAFLTALCVGTMALGVAFTPVDGGNVAHAKSIDSLMENSTYFAGKYSGKMKKGGNGVKTILEMNQYSSYDSGKKVGNFTFRAWGGRVKPDGVLKRIGKDKYKYSKFCQKGTSLVFQVKKNSVVVTQSGKKLYFQKTVLDFSGNYKLKKRFYS